MIRVIFSLCTALGTMAASAGLVFEQPILELPAPPGTREVSGVFHFKNTGSDHVKIRKVRTSCGCTTTKLPKLTYAPGETGEIKTNFRFGFAKGALRKLITVELADETEIPLEIRTTVQVPLTAKPTLLFWRKGSAPDPKRVALGIQRDLPIQVQSASSDHPDFLTVLKKEKGGYSLVVTPRTTAVGASGRITVKTDYPPEDPATVTIYARVR